MKFTKMQGIGNDYVYVDCFKEQVKNPAETAVKLSDRHFGVGSDGLILIKPSKAADFEMEMYNADGSRGEMCGNGIRCVAKYVYDKGLTDKTEITVEAGGSVKYLELTLKEGKVSLVKVNMGKPELLPEKIPVLAEGRECVDMPLEVKGNTYQVTCVSMGNPHCVTFLEEEVRNLDLLVIGPDFENHPCFPKRVNTEFINVLDKKHLRMRVWERGSGETLACGTGACAAGVAAMLNGYTEDEVTVHLLGGDLKIQWDREENNVYMTGPAAIVFEGEIDV